LEQLGNYDLRSRDDSAIAEVKQRWSVIGLMTKNLLLASEGTFSRWFWLHLQSLALTNLH
jgi:hypothetical protein